MLGPGDVVVDRYRLVRRLADGGMGTVWEGWDERLRRPVAIKQLHVPQGLSEQDADAVTQRAMREARLTARLHHPNAVPVYDIVDHEARPCLVMQYVPSTSLQQLVRDKGALPVGECARIGSEIASALAAAHAVGIVHRDVKPGNVLITEDGTAKITDFGISHALDDITVTSTGMVSGTPAYLAPEVARGADSSFASDVFSLGATLYFAVEGTPPFGTGANPMATLHRVASGQPNPPIRSGAVTPALAEMLAQDPADRPPMVDVAQRLAAVADASPESRPDSLPDEATWVMPLPAPTPSTATPEPPSATPEPPSASPEPPSASPGPPSSALPEPPPGSPSSAPPESPPVTTWLASSPRARLQALSLDSSSAGRPRRGGRRRLLIPVLGALVVIGLALVIALVLINPTGGSGTGAATGTTGASSPTQSTRSTPAPSTSASATAAAGAELSQAVVDYYRLLPGNTDAGWQLLTGGYRNSHAQGRTSYNEFWGSVRRVSVAAAKASGPGTVTATITYFYKNGRVVDERTTFGLTRDGGTLKIATTTVLSSVTR
jgi:eukaryotic-like serine/threonine-protein kinase